MHGGIYLLQSDDQLQELIEQPYESERLLQQLLARYPHLLAGKQIDPASPRRWLLVSREAALPSEEGGGGTFAVDHLFLDQDGTPTLVEVKRSSDTRIRRELVGQMLDYAANAVAYWPIETVRALFEARCQAEGLDVEQVLSEFLEPETEIETFWQQVNTNLRIGRIRMLFVADEVPPELQRIVEFLNEQLSQAEMLAVEIKQYVGQGLRSLVPRVIGQTAGAQQKRAGAAGPAVNWDEPSFFQELARTNPNGVGGARALLEWAKSKTTRVWWGHGKRTGSFVPVLNHQGRDHQLFAVWTSGTIEIYFQWYQYKPPFDSEEKRRMLLDRLNAIPGVMLPNEVIARRPNIPLALVQDEAALRQMLETWDWVREEISAT